MTQALIEPHDAVLTDWVIGHDGAGAILLGTILEDRKGRFVDGRPVHTSYLQTGAKGIVEGAVVRTLNTRYLLGRKAEKPSVKQCLAAIALEIAIEGGPIGFVVVMEDPCG